MWSLEWSPPAAAEETERLQDIRACVHKAVVSRAKELTDYVEPNVMANLSIAAVREGGCDLCEGVL